MAERGRRRRVCSTGLLRPGSSGDDEGMADTWSSQQSPAPFRRNQCASGLRARSSSVSTAPMPTAPSWTGPRMRPPDWGRPLRVVTVIDAGVQMTSYEVLASAAPSLEELLRDEVHPVVDAAATRARTRHPSLDIAVSTPMETAAGALVRLSEGARRLVIGGPAKGHLGHVFLGSVALPVVAHAHCPVIVVPAGTAVSPPRRIVVGVDGSDPGRHAVEFAFEAAQLCGAAVIAVLVWHRGRRRCGRHRALERALGGRGAAVRGARVARSSTLQPLAIQGSRWRSACVTGRLPRCSGTQRSTCRPT